MVVNGYDWSFLGKRAKGEIWWILELEVGEWYHSIEQISGSILVSVMGCLGGGCILEMLRWEYHGNTWL